MIERKGVLLLSPFFHPNVGGVETHLNDLCRGLVKKNCFVYVLTYQPIAVKTKGLKEERGKNFYIRRLWWPGFNLFHKFESLPPIFNFLYLTSGLFFLSLTFMFKNQKKISVIHAQGVAAAFIAVVLKKIFQTPVIISTHAIYSFNKENLFARVVKTVFNSADMVLALAEGSKKELVKIGVKKEKIGRYTYWVDQTIFRLGNKTKAKKALHLEGKFTVLFVGRLIEIKGARTLVEIAKEVGDKINFLFVGVGPLEEELKVASRRNKNILFAGRIDNREVPRYFSVADVFVIPSKYPEGFARVVLEALSCGLPVLASNMGVIPEEINPKVGILVNPTVREIKEKILWLYHHPKTLAEMSQSAFEFSRERYSEKNILPIIEAYEKVS
jgi:glycosyltransferase involved in cell wall biosynthesis